MSVHKGATDKVHTVDLEGRIETARWALSRAAAGTNATLRVTTRRVGEGAPITVEVKTVKGKKITKLEGAVWLATFEAEVAVPADCKDDLEFEAQLKKHKLKAKSDVLHVVPGRKLENAAWDREEARRGDVVGLTADAKGFPNGTRVPIVIFEHDDDCGHDFITEIEGKVDKDKLVAQWAYEYHEDTDDIPKDGEAEKGYAPPEYFFRAGADGVTVDSGLLLFKDYVDIDLKVGGQPAAGEEYTLTLPDGAERKGKLDDEGRAREKDVPPGPFSVKFPQLSGGGGSGGTA